MTDTTPAPEGVNWGTTNTPVEDRINIGREHRTRDGKRVIGLQCVLHNSCGREVTFPIKGSIVVREKPFHTRFALWTLDGRSGFDGPSGDDLVEVD